MPLTLTAPFAPTREAALARLRAVRPTEYATSRNAVEGAVTYLSPYITHGLLSLPEVLAAVTQAHALKVQHKLVFELGWRDYFRHVWQKRGDGILEALHEGPLPEELYARVLPADIRQAATGVRVIDEAVRTLYASGYLHNHARMWLASYIVHIRKIHWRVAADWLYGHLLDGDLASNHLSWQWVAGTGSNKPYLFNADNVARFAPTAWHSPGSVIDQSYEALDRLARTPTSGGHEAAVQPHTQIEPPLLGAPPPELGGSLPDAKAVADQEVWLVHPWNLGELPAHLPANTVIVGLWLKDFHSQWPWSERRWQFVGPRMAALTQHQWHADASHVIAALRGARRVRSVAEPHLAPWLPQIAQCAPSPALFPMVERRCDSFSQWWTRVTRGLGAASDLLTAHGGTVQARQENGFP